MGATVANRNRKMRQEQLREWLSKQKLIEKVIDIDREIGTLKAEVKVVDDKAVIVYPDFELKKLQARAGLNFKLIDKYLADLKSVEATVEHFDRNVDEYSDGELADIITRSRSGGTSQEKISEGEPPPVH